MTARTSDLLRNGVVEHLIGVIDLKRGRAVHAVAGCREAYTPVACTDGDPVALARHYAGLGLKRLYLADLDAIETGTPQIDSISRVLSDGERFESVLLDAGWRGDPAPDSAGQMIVTRFADRFANLRFVAATESAISLQTLDVLTQRVSAARIILSLDHRGGQLIGPADLDRWVDAAERLAIDQLLVLDLEAVGTSRGAATTELCRQVKTLAPVSRLLSGGGIRCAQDVRQLLSAGCDQCLVATALHDAI